MFVAARLFSHCAASFMLRNPAGDPAVADGSILLQAGIALLLIGLGLYAVAAAALRDSAAPPRRGRSRGRSSGVPVSQPVEIAHA